MALQSPGTEITIIDESQYLSAAPSSTPLIVLATAQNKVNASGTGVAPGTTAANANKIYRVTSQRDLVTLFGNPFFYKTTNGTPIQGYELNEYGLLASYSVLGNTNLIYAIRANIDLAALVGRTGRPSSDPTNGSWWLNTASSTWGIFEFNATTGNFVNKLPLIITNPNDISGGAPLSSLGTIGSYAVNLTQEYGLPSSWQTYWYKNSNNTWVAVGSPEWQASWPTVAGTSTSPTIVTGGRMIITSNTNSSVISGVINNGISSSVAGTTLTVTQIVSGLSLAVGTVITGTGITPGTYITALGTGTGGVGTYTVNNSQLVGTSVASVTGYIGTAATSGTASTTLTVTGVTNGTLSVGTYLAGSVNVAAGSFVTGSTYRIGSLGTTDFNTIGATSGVSGFDAWISGIRMYITTATTGTTLPGRYISGTGVTAGTFVNQQIGVWVAQKTYTSGGAVSTNTVVLNNVTSVAVGQFIVDSAGLIPVGTTVTAVDSGTSTVTLSANFTGSAAALSTYEFYTDVSLVTPVAPTYASGGAQGSTTVALSSVVGISVGNLVTGSGVAGNTTVTAVNTSTNTVTLSASLNAQADGTYLFYPSGWGVKGIYKVSASQSVGSYNAPVTMVGQPTVATQFTATGAGSGTGVAYSTITPGTYITALGTGTGGVGTYTVSISQAINSGTVTGFRNSLSGQNGTIIVLSTGQNASSIANTINSSNIPFVAAAVVDGKINIYDTRYSASYNNGAVYVAGDTGTLADIGITPGAYYVPGLSYGTNAAQPLWRSTDASPHPSGSVWIKTNSGNGGMNIDMSQYSSSVASYLSKTVRVAANDWTINNVLDSTGGKAIPANTVYAQEGNSTIAPVEIYYRAATGPSVFVGTDTTPNNFEIGSQLFVQVSQPGSTSLLPSDSTTANSTTRYVVTLAGTTGADFVTAWLAADIPYTTAAVDGTTGAIVLTHTEGGVIILDDSPSLNANPAKVSPLNVAGFTPYDPSTATGTLGAKWGNFKYVDVTATGSLATTGGNGTGLTLNLTTFSYSPSFTVAVGGAGYSVGDIVTVVGGNPYGGGSYQVKVNAVSGGVVTGVTHFTTLATPAYSVELSNWYVFDYTPDTTAPVNAPANGTLWFYSVINQVDIMTNLGGVWKGYLNVAYDSNGLPYSGANLGNNSSGPIISASQPAAQSDGTPLVYGDLWINTSDLDNYPVINRWQSVNGNDQWVKIDNTDQTTENGILFADARWGSSGNIDPVNDPIPTIASLLTSDYTDLDVPSSSAYPQGTLLFNTRRSGYNVKRFATNYFNATSFPGAVLPTYKNAWVTASGNMSNGAPYMGRKAQRAMVVQAMKSCIDTSTELRDEQTVFNLLATPNYPELQPNMIALNNDRNQTAYIIGDTPLRLADNANAITAWATNAAGATTTGEDGLVSRSSYMGLYYPSGITTDLTGSEVVVPASHMILRTMIYNDTVAYPWLAPAGQRRGIVDNVTNIGYINQATGEFVTTKNRVGLRDIEYNNFINPIAFFENVGILNFGNKNSFDSQSALDRTNVARLICYIRERLQSAVRPFLFEPNDSMTRSQVKAVVQTLLADIQSKRGLYDYLVVCDNSNNTTARIDRNELWVDIAIEPVKAVEFIYIPVRILNTGEVAGLAQNG